MSELAIIDPSKARISETALELSDATTHEDWVEVGEALGRASRASAWWIGDWINYANEKWGEKYDEAQRITGLSYNYLAACARVSRKFQFSDRALNLSWTHHYKVESLPNPRDWIARAEAENWSVRELVANTAPLRKPGPSRIYPEKRHAAVIDAADELVKKAALWQKEMTQSLTPPQARKQLTILNKAADALAEIIEAVEYRAATLHSFVGH